MRTRKGNRLKGYDYSQNGAYSITICVKDRKAVLGQIVGADCGNQRFPGIGPQMKLSPYGKIVEEEIRRIPGLDHYVLIPNHLHFIVQIQRAEWGTERSPASAPTQSVSQMVRKFKIRVTKRVGCPLFQRSFHDHIIRNTADYQRIWQYIETNPLKWENDCFYTRE